MKINKNSWHYKRADSHNYPVSNSLCLYFWQVVWGVVFWWTIVPCMVILAAAFIFGVLPVAPGIFVHWLFGFSTPPTKLGEYLLNLAEGYALLSVVALCMFSFIYWKRNIRKDKPKRPDNFVLAYIKAKKEKVCPIIEFTSGDKE